jgi:hypothetical protein
MQTQIVKIINDFEHGRLSRRQLIAYLSGMFAASLGASIGFADQQPGRAAPNPADPASTFDATDLNHIALSVTDVQRSQKWYQKHLGLKPTGREGFLTTGKGWLALFHWRKARLESLLLQHRELRSSRCGRETQSRRPHAQTRRRACIFCRSGRHRMSGRECVTTLGEQQSICPTVGRLIARSHSRCYDSVD